MRAHERVVMAGDLLKRFFSMLSEEDEGCISEKTLELWSRYGS
jgi:hypothetical protein